MLDTMGIDIAKDLKGYSEFFYNFLPVDREITMINSKLPPEIIIKNEYFNKTDKVSTKGLFSVSKVMCYCFVFDVNDLKTFNSVFYIATLISNIEQAKIDEDEYKPIKVFIGNKFDEGENENSNNSDGFYHSQKFINEYVNNKGESLLEVYNKLVVLFKSDKEALENFYLTSVKFNFNIENLFVSVLRKINQKDKLWKNIDYDDSIKNRRDSDEEVFSEKEKKRSIYDKIFCCFPKQNLNNKLDHEVLLDKQKNHLNGGDISDEDNDSDYDLNETLKVGKENEIKLQEKNKCSIF
jgi:hypothetical protein